VKYPSSSLIVSFFIKETHKKECSFIRCILSIIKDSLVVFVLDIAIDSQGSFRPVFTQALALLYKAWQYRAVQDLKDAPQAGSPVSLLCPRLLAMDLGT
jgi:hypothetical protein